MSSVYVNVASKFKVSDFTSHKKTHRDHYNLKESIAKANKLRNTRYFVVSFKAGCGVSLVPASDCFPLLHFSTSFASQWRHLPPILQPTGRASNIGSSAISNGVCSAKFLSRVEITSNRTALKIFFQKSMCM